MNDPSLKFVEAATAADLETVRRIAAVIWPETFKSILSKEQIIYMMKMMYAPEVMEEEMSKGYHFRLLHVDGAPVGYTSWSAYHIPGTAKLHKLYLLSQFHSKGIGARMIADVADEARQRGFKTLRLNVNKHNSRAMRSYLRNGFSQVESVKIDIGNGFFMDDFGMEKPL